MFFLYFCIISVSVVCSPDSSYKSMSNKSLFCLVMSRSAFFCKMKNQIAFWALPLQPAGEFLYPDIPTYPLKILYTRLCLTCLVRPKMSAY